MDDGRGTGDKFELEVGDSQVHIQVLEQEEEQEDGRSSHSSDSLHQLDY